VLKGGKISSACTTIRLTELVSEKAGTGQRGRRLEKPEFLTAGLRVLAFPGKVVRSGGIRQGIFCGKG